MAETRPHELAYPSSPEQAVAAWLRDAGHRETHTLDGGQRLALATSATGDVVRVHLACDATAPLLLHWGIARVFAHEWELPPEDSRVGMVASDQHAVRTPFTERDGLRYLELQFRRPAAGPGPRGMKFVLYQPDGSRWLKSAGKDLYVTLFQNVPDARVGSPKSWELAERIVAAERGAASWTLMHRFTLCRELLDVAQDDAEALPLFFVWLRFSALRQLDWQRRYNTKPRELSLAQDRLTARLGNLWRRSSAVPGADGHRLWVRLLLTTLGRGGDGQRIRDEILHIMHRNHLKEVSGDFIEEWHQKLHNNTTPDDIVICQAYLEFLRSHGDRGRFYQTLADGGVTRARLQSFERAIRTDPEFYADHRDALLRDFEGFLAILKAVHAGTDLESAASAARGRLDWHLQQELDALVAPRHRNPAVTESAARITFLRQGLPGVAATAAVAGDDAGLRDILFLDLALEEALRSAIERQNLSQFDRDRLVELFQFALRNLTLSIGSAELAHCAEHWATLAARPRDGQDWALHAKSIADRTARWIQSFTGELYERLQPRADFLGGALRVEPWSVAAFSEEVIRGGPVFATALLLRHLDPILREAAGLGDWQVISPGRAVGRIHVVDRLLDVQGETFPEATVLVAAAVTGAEEIARGVTAVLTPDTPDLVSHVAVRARNAGVLFATCFEPQTIDRLRSMAGRLVALGTTSAGDVDYSESNGVYPAVSRPRPVAPVDRRPHPMAAPAVAPMETWVVTPEQFAPGIVGAKSNNLHAMRGRLPDWIHRPVGLALPFGTFERALADDCNRDLRHRYEALLKFVATGTTEALPQLRALLLSMASPVSLRSAVFADWERVGLPAIPWEQAWHAVRRVWASQWSERAVLSRRNRSVPHHRLRMAVLIQQVVEADYAYVIHTVNPLTGNPDEIYGEVVLGLGETLVGNYPGRALSFVCRKSELASPQRRRAELGLQLVAYPSKSVGLYGRGVIFRSDSNGEDLEDFAGAGLYDSYLAEEPTQRILDYTRERLVWDTGFQGEMLRSIACVGLEVERLLGSPQDVEGAVAGDRYFIVQTRPQVGLGLTSVAA